MQNIPEVVLSVPLFGHAAWVPIELSSALVAEISATLAADVLTTHNLLHPGPAGRALLEFQLSHGLVLVFQTLPLVLNLQTFLAVFSPTLVAAVVGLLVFDRELTTAVGSATGSAMLVSVQILVVLEFTNRLFDFVAEQLIDLLILVKVSVTALAKAACLSEAASTGLNVPDATVLAEQVVAVGKVVEPWLGFHANFTVLTDDVPAIKAKVNHKVA